MKRVISVKFASDGGNSFNSKSYSYYTDDDTIQIGDYVVVAVDSMHNLIPKVTQVAETHGLSKNDRDKACKWIVGKIDLLEYKEKQAIEKKINEVRAQLRQRREEMEDMIIFRELSKSDPKTKELLNTLDVLELEYDNPYKNTK